MKIQEQFELFRNNPYNQLRMLKTELIMAKFSRWFMSEKKYIEYLDDVSKMIDGFIDKGYRLDYHDFVEIYYKGKANVERDKMFNVFWLYRWFKFKANEIYLVNRHFVPEKTKPKKYYNYLLEQICLFEECIDFEGEQLLYKIFKDE